MLRFFIVKLPFVANVLAGTTQENWVGVRRTLDRILNTISNIILKRRNNDLNDDQLKLEL